MTTEAISISDEDREALRDSIRSVLAQEAGSSDIHAHIDGKATLDASLWRQAGDLGWTAIALPETYGGFGFGAAGSVILNHELGRACAPGPFLPTVVGAQVLADCADADICEAWLPQIISAAASIAIPATPCGATPMALAAGKVSGVLTMLGAPDASLALVPLESGALAAIELSASQCEPQDFWDRTRSVVRLTLADAQPAALLPDHATAALRDAFALAVAADSVGLSRSIVEKTIAYMQEREQFGRPIGSFQALKHRVVDLVAKVEIAEHIVDNAADCALVGDPSAGMWAALAKAEASDAAAFIAGDCVQLHGGVGFTWEFDVHIHLKRARLNQMLVAGNEKLRDLAAQELAECTRAGVSTLELAF